MKKQSKALMILSILAAFSTSAYAVTGSVSTYLEVESNHSTADNTNVLDKITAGIGTRLNLSDKTSLMLDVKNSNQDYLESSTTGVSSKGRTKINVAVNNTVIKTEKGAMLNLGYGFEVWQDYTGSTSGRGNAEKLFYKFLPGFTYPITKNIAITGNYMLALDKTDTANTGIGEYKGYYELFTGVRYTGIPKYTLEAQIYNYAENPTVTEESERENQLRASVSTTVAGYKIKPNVKFDLGDYEIKTSTGEFAGSTRHRNEYELEISKMFDKVNYTVAYRYCTADYTKSTAADEYTNFVKLQAQY